MVSTRRQELERVFDSPQFTARLRRGVYQAAVRASSFVLRVGGQGVARELESLHVSIVTHRLASLAPSADGCRLLHLSDLHLESLRAWETVTSALGQLEWDALLFTGDFAEGPHAPELVSRFVAALPERPEAPRVAVLGNHDRSCLLPGLEAGGFDVLINRSRPLGDRWPGIWIVGVDDPATFRTHDLNAALSGVTGRACTILMAHSPDLAVEASTRGCALYLCGHTHGGQVVLPRFGPVGYRRRYPRERIAGAWRVGDMAGYTSVGLGARYGLVRVGCNPEIAIHELRCPPSR